MAGGAGGPPRVGAAWGIPLPLPCWSLYLIVVLTLPPPPAQLHLPGEPTGTTLGGLGEEDCHRQSKVLPPLPASAKVFPAPV